MQVPSPTRRNAVVLVALLFAQLVMMSESARGSGKSARIESWWMRASSPLIAVGKWIGNSVHGSVSGVGDMFSARSRNTELETELARLRSELARHREASLETVRLRQLLEMRADLVPHSIGASVVTLKLTENEHMIIVDRGLRDGVRRDMSVVAWGGAVGRIIGLGPRHAKVRLLTDPSSGIAGTVQRSRAQGLVVGRGAQRVDLLYVPRFSDVSHGDRVVASGLDGIFPRGVGVGRVVAITQTPDGSQTIELVPELDYRHLEEVLILLEPVSAELLSPEPPGVDS